MKSKADRKIEAKLQLTMIGRSVCYCCDSGPDYSSIAAANEKSAQFAKETAEADLAFRKQQYADMQPQIAQSWDIANQVSQGQLADAATSRERATSSWNRWQDVGIRQQDQMIAEANAYGSEADQQAQADKAVATAKELATSNRQANTRAMERMGVNPASGRFAAPESQSAIQEAAMEAAAANNARTQSKDKGISLRAGVSAALAGQPNIAGQQMGLSTASGSSAVGNVNTGVNSGINWANYASGGVGNAIGAANLNIQSNLGLGQMEAQSSAGMGSMIGGLGMAAATMM